MDIRTIYVVWNEYDWDYESVKSELMAEGYRHNFYFSNKRGYDKDTLKKAEEVWLFGNCENRLDLHYAKEMGSDIWQMG